jgi:hypothetical protein
MMKVEIEMISFDFQACEPAARLALADVNNKEDLLPGYHLNLHWNDSGVSLSSFLLLQGKLLHVNTNYVNINMLT